ncbi:MAG: NADH-dependent butanol dehydrogenase [Bacteroidota bacterium]|jgi:alcohol dehydrogenase YqhD (iron-dependent ADH family)
MHNFTAYNPTILHFGKNVTDNLGKAVTKYGTKAILLSGKGSVKRNGYYDRITEQLNKAGVSFVEFDGIKPNPLAKDADTASKLATDFGAQVVVAIGGGSVIDTAKIVTLCIANQVQAWDVMKGKARPTSALPLVAVLTLAATGTEMNAAAVLQNHETSEKLGYVHPLIYPKESFLDPLFTLSVPKNYTAYGVADLVAHTLENYFGSGDAPLTDEISYAIIREAVTTGPALLADLQNYELRERIMWAATLALNGTTSAGKNGGDWGVHGMGHEMSLLFDTPHGASLTIGYIAWLKLQAERIPERIASLGKNVFGTTTAAETIAAFGQFFQTLQCPTSLDDLEFTAEQKQEYLAQLQRNKVSGMVQQLSTEDLSTLVSLMN